MKDLLIGAGAFAAGVLVKKLIDDASKPKTLTEIDNAADQLYIDAGYTFSPKDGSLIDPTGKPVPSAVSGLGDTIKLVLDPDDPSRVKAVSTKVLPGKTVAYTPPTLPTGPMTYTPPSITGTITPPIPPGGSGSGVVASKRSNGMQGFVQGLMYPHHPKYNEMFGEILRKAQASGLKVTAVVPYGYPIPT